MELESLRFQGKFEYVIEIDKLVNLEIKIPSLLIQPYVENAIWHGIMHKPEKYGKVEVKIINSNNFIKCTITDDGIGRKKAFEISANANKTHKSYGITITEKRLQIYNSLYGANVNVQLYDLVDKFDNPIGTKVEIFLIQSSI